MWLLATPSAAWAVQGETPAATSERKNSVVPDVLAEPISPATVRRFNHLADFQGHILLAGAGLHVVLAGVPPEASTALWRPAVLATFELNTSRSATSDDWRRNDALGAIDLRHATSPDLQALAVDLGTAPEQGAAYATFVFVADAQKTRRQLVTYRLDAAAARLAVVFDDYVEGTSPSAAANGAAVATPPTTTPVSSSRVAHRWHLKLRPVHAGLLLAKTQTRGGATGRTHLLAYSADAMLGLVAYRPFAAANVASAAGEGDGATVTQVELIPQVSAGVPSQEQPVEGYELLLTRASAATLLRRADDVGECLHGAFRPKALPRAEARLAWTLGCATDAPRTALQLTLPPDDAGADVAAQPVFVFAADGTLLQVTALFAGERLDLDLPHDVSMLLADTASGRLLAEAKPFTLARGEQQQVRLAARSSGVVRLDLGRDRDPAFLRVNRLDLRSGGGSVVRIDAAGPPVERLARDTWLVKGWPVQLDLVSGAYEVEVARGGQGDLCQLKFRASPGKVTTLRCAAWPSSLATSAPVEAPRDDAATYVDLSFDATVSHPRLYAAALGVEWLARPLSSDAATEPVVTSLKDPRGDRLLPVLRVIDEATGVSLQVIPATAALVQRWGKVKPAMPQDQLPALVRLAREEARGALIELGCPGPAITLGEYEIMVRRLAPDAVRLFGCGGTASDAEWLALWTRLSVERGEPLLLTPASEMNRPGWLRFPRLALAVASEGQDPMRHLLGALVAQRTSVSAGARVELQSVTLSVAEEGGAQSPVAARSKGPKAPRAAEAVVRVVALGGGGPLTVMLHTETGVLKSERLPDAASAPLQETTLELSFALPEGTRWLRAEILGGADRILATTGLLSVADLLTSAKSTTPTKSAQEAAPPKGTSP